MDVGIRGQAARAEESGDVDGEEREDHRRGQRDQDKAPPVGPADDFVGEGQAMKPRERWRDGSALPVGDVA